MQEIEELKNALIDELNPEQIYLFGSYAKGTNKEDSDIDFYIIVDDAAGKITDLTARAYDATTWIKKRPLDIMVQKKSDFLRLKEQQTFENEVFRTGVAIYG